MPVHRIDDYIGNALIGDVRKTTIDFFEYLSESQTQFERGKGYWADKLYWMAKYKDEYVCFVLINGDENGQWIIWSDDSGSDWYADALMDDRMKEIAWKHIDICGNCGGCKNPGGSQKTILGKEFDNVCITAMKFTNPDAETVECLKRLVELRKNAIDKNARKELVLS